MEESTVLEATLRIGERVPVSGLFASTSQTLKRLPTDSHGNDETGFSATKRQKNSEDEPSKKRRDSHCFVCHKKGGDPLCKTCHRVYHRYCAAKCSPCDVISRSKSNNLSTEKICKLIETVILLLREVDKDKVFHNAVDLEEYPDYLEVVHHPIDLKVMYNKAVSRKYNSFESFLNDINQLYHNSVVYNTTSAWVTSVAAKLQRRAATQFKEIKKCPTCFLRHSKGDPEWFIKPCSDPHLIVWAKVRSYPFWPAKMVGLSEGMVDVIFFGDHSRANVKVKDCFLYGEDLFLKGMTTYNKPGYEKMLKVAMKELSDHLARIKVQRGDVRLPAVKVAFDPNNLEEQKKLMFPDIVARGSIIENSQEPKKRSLLYHPIKDCRVVLKPLAKPVGSNVSDYEKSADTRSDENFLTLTPPENDETLFSGLEESRPCITNVQTLRVPDHINKPTPSDENFIESHQQLACCHNAVSSTSDSNISKIDFDLDLNDCLSVLLRLSNKVVSLASQEEETQVGVEISSSLVSQATQDGPSPLWLQNSSKETQTSEEEVACKPKITVRKDLVVPNTSNQFSNGNPCEPPTSVFLTNQTGGSVLRGNSVASLLPAAKSALESFDGDKMANYIIEAFDSIKDRDELMKRIFHLNEKFAVHHANLVESMKANFEIDRKVYLTRISVAEALAVRASSKVEQNPVVQDPLQPINYSMDASTPAARPSRRIKCNHCQNLATLDCCPQGSYCSYTCQSEDWIRHCKVCHNCDEVITNIEMVALSASDSGQSRNRRAHKRKSTSTGYAALPSHSHHGNSNLLALPSTSSTLNPRNYQQAAHTTTRTVRSTAGDSGGKLTMAARKMMPPNLSDLDSLTHGPPKRQMKRPNVDQGS